MFVICMHGGMNTRVGETQAGRKETCYVKIKKRGKWGYLVIKKEGKGIEREGKDKKE